MPGTEKIQRLRTVFDHAVASLEPELRAQAFTHISWSNEQGDTGSSNERLEFLGDAVISLAVALHLYENHPQVPEGDLTRMRASLVSGTSLAAVAKAVGLGRHLKLGRGEELTGGRERPKTLAGALEAFFGAYFIRHGWDKVRALTEQLLLDTEIRAAPIDPKTMLQEIVQSRPGSKLEYVVVDVTGPDHMPEYTVACVIDGRRVSTGKGSSKKEAEEDAARNWLVRNGYSDGASYDKNHLTDDEIGRQE
ncbi:MAG: ribonuclease III [Bacillota bacterium]|nr:ribonuclease III [Candidatus Fermentithermobacillaceae bacterium]